MTTKRAHKQWQLHKKQNFLEKELETILDRFICLKKTSGNLTNGFMSNEPNVSENKKTSIQKCAKLHLMLGLIPNYATTVSCNTIVKYLTSLNESSLQFESTVASTQQR